MPINANIGNISYVAVCAAGAAMALGGVGGLTIGALVSFITLNRNFSQPITQVSQQMSFVTMAAAGAERVFALMDEAPEEDHGYVELVNAREAPDGSLEPCEERTGVWVWRHPHAADGSVTYHKLEGALVMDHVDFGYTPDKRVLHDITLYANPGQKIAFVGSTGASSSGAAMTSSWRSAAATGRSIPEALRTTDRLVARPDTREGTRLRPRPLTYGQA